MSWRDDLSRVTLADGRRLIGASFRGVPFLVDESYRGGGRRTVLHEFPGRDDPYIEDQGRRARSFSLDGYVVGDDYVAARDALLAALEDESGSGELVHPYFGALRAICTDLTVRESRQDGRIAYFQLGFTEVPVAAVAPVDSPDQSAQVRAAATDAADATAVEFLADYDVDGQPSFALESLAAELSAIGAALDEALAPVGLATQEAAALAAETELLGLEAASLVREPTDMLAALYDALGALGEAVATAPREILVALLDVAALVGSVLPAPGATATRIQERANQSALNAVLRRVLAIEAARLIVDVEYNTADDAQADAALVAASLEDEAAIAGNDAYPALVELRTRVLRAVPGDAILARVETVDRATAVPSILLSYQLYGSQDREADIVARNDAIHPGFLAGSLQVVSSG